MSAFDWDLRPVTGALARRYVSEGHWSDETLGQFLEPRLRRDRHLEARVWSAERPFLGTIGEVRDLAHCFAGGLRARGVGPGDVVAMQLPNWVEAAATFYAVALLGAVAVPVVHFYGPKELRFILSESGARVLVTAARFGNRDYLADLDTIRGDLVQLETVVVAGSSHSVPSGTVAYERVADSPPLRQPAGVDPNAPALVAYTSGTTSDPKGVIHSHRTIVFELRQLAELQAERVRPLLVGAPVGHGIGMLSGLLVPRERAQPLYLIDVWNPAAVLDAVLEADISAGSGSTYFLTSLLDAPGCSPEHVRRMDKIGLGGSPIPAAVAERAERLGINLVRSYGSTEHPSTTGSLHRDPPDKRLYTDGRLLPQVEARIVEPGTGRDLAPGEAGEIVSRGPDRFVGYTDSRSSDDALDADGWFHTGDIGYFDPDGFLVVTDREKDIIIRGGENISAAEVEGLLAALPGVAEVAVVAAPDERLGEHACAFVRTTGSESVDLEAIRRHLAGAGLARQKWPEELLVVDEFPRTSSGKIQKFTLRDRLRRRQ